MAREESLQDVTPTLSFDRFWSWLVSHPNCILRAGTQEAVLYDDDDLHWHFADDGPDLCVVQVIRGKRLMGEVLIQTEPIAFVQGYEGDQEGEFVFELIAELETERLAPYFFVLCHPYEEEDIETHGRAVH